MTDFVLKMIFKASADCDKIQMVDNADKLGFGGVLHPARDPSRRCFPSRHSRAKRRISRENILFEDDTGGKIKQTDKSKFEKTNEVIHNA